MSAYTIIVFVALLSIGAWLLYGTRDLISLGLSSYKLFLSLKDSMATMLATLLRRAHGIRVSSSSYAHVPAPLTIVVELEP